MGVFAKGFLLQGVFFPKKKTLLGLKGGLSFLDRGGFEGGEKKKPFSTKSATKLIKKKK